MKVPHHLAIIIDGNRRWAQKRGLPKFVGHQQGLKNVERIGKWAQKRGVKILTLYAFSTENWGRSKREVGYLMKLLESALDKDKKNIQELQKRGIKVRVIGQRKRLSKRLQKLIRETEELTKNNKKGILNLAISYGGRQEILEATKKILKKKTPYQKIDEKIFEENLWTKGLAHPDFIIRTGGERRLSNFLLWQSAYAELYFSDKLWPDFKEKDLDRALEDFASRQRRFGK
jgi:undecaprenyl diphosphate synthase